MSRTAIVTGGGSGIGRAASIRLAGDGYFVVVADIDPEGAEVTLRSVLEVGRGTALEVDVRQPASVEGMVEGALKAGGSVDALVCSAGIAGPSLPGWELPLETWDEVLTINLSGVFYACRAVLPHMVSQGWGRVVAISSIAGKEGNPNAAAYSASKAGVIGLTKALAKEVVTSGVLVNCLTPAVIETPILRQVSEEHRQYMLSRIPMRRAGRPEEVAALISWLCSEECSFSTGAVFDISGGRATY